MRSSVSINLENSEISVNLRSGFCREIVHNSWDVRGAVEKHFERLDFPFCFFPTLDVLTLLCSKEGRSGVNSLPRRLRSCRFLELTSRSSDSEQIVHHNILWAAGTFIKLSDNCFRIDSVRRTHYGFNRGNYILDSGDMGLKSSQYGPDGGHLILNISHIFWDSVNFINFPEQVI